MILSLRIACDYQQFLVDLFRNGSMLIRKLSPHQAGQRIVVASRAAEIAGFPALRTVLEACARPAAVSLPDTPAFIPTTATAIAPALPMATILLWVARSAPRSLCVIFGPVLCASLTLKTNQ